MWFFAIFLPPLYLLMRGRILAAICNFLLIATGTVLIPFFGIGFILILIAIIQSGMDYKKNETEKFVTKQAEANAKAMAKHIRNQG